MKRLILILFIFVAGILEAAEPLPVKEIHLKNGMTFLLLPRGESPIFSVSIRFKVGGMDEEPGKSGLAHLVEHMAFKGTKEIVGKVEFQRLYERHGAQGLNAGTSKDFTTYYVSFPADQFGFWARLESERIFQPVFREFEEERRVVIEEKHMRVNNNPLGKFYEQFIKKAFQKTPYEWSLGGELEDLNQLTVSDLEDFYQKHYHPENAVAAVVGRFDEKEAVKVIQETFGKVPSGKAVKPVTFTEHSLGEESSFELKENAETRLMIGYPKPAFPDRDAMVLDLAGEILGGGRSSRLYQKLVIEKKMLADLWYDASTPGDRGPNLFLIQLTPLPGHEPKKILEAFDAVVQEFIDQGPTERETETAVNQTELSFLSHQETNMDLAEMLSYYESLTGDWQYLQKYPETLASFTPANLQKTAAQFLSKERRLVGVMQR